MAAALRNDPFDGDTPMPEGAMGEAEPAERMLRAALAAKILHAWAENRQQVLVPLTLKLGWLEPAGRILIVQAMAAALAACGMTTEVGQARLSAALAQAGGDAEQAAAANALARPPDLIVLLADIEKARLGAHAYAAAALVLDRRVALERAFLDWLAARFTLPPALTADLARRYRR